MVIIYAKFVELDSSSNRCFKIKIIKKLHFFYRIWAWWPSWSFNLDYLYKLSFPVSMEVPHENKL